MIKFWRMLHKRKQRTDLVTYWMSVRHSLVHFVRTHSVSCPTLSVIVFRARKFFIRYQNQIFSVPGVNSKPDNTEQICLASRHVWDTELLLTVRTDMRYTYSVLPDWFYSNTRTQTDICTLIYRSILQLTDTDWILIYVFRISAILTHLPDTSTGILQCHACHH